MKIERNEDGSANIQMSAEEVENFKAALQRMTASFVGLTPVVHRLIAGLKSFEKDLKESGAAALCQRLDPAFSGPAVEYSGETWSASTPPHLRALRKGEPTEPGQSLGSGRKRGTEWRDKDEFGPNAR